MNLLDWSFVISLLFLLASFLIRSQSTVFGRFSAALVLYLNFYLAAQMMEHISYYYNCWCVCVCVNVSVSFLFLLSVCIEQNVLCDIQCQCATVVCGLFVTLCTGPQGHTHYIHKQLSAVLPKMKTNRPHAVKRFCIDSCGSVPSVLCIYIILYIW